MGRTSCKTFGVSINNARLGWSITYQKSTLGASFRLMKYSSLIATSCSLMAVSNSSSLPVLEDIQFQRYFVYQKITYTLKTSSAVLRTMNDRGSDCLNHSTWVQRNSIMESYSFIHPDGKFRPKNSIERGYWCTYLWPNPDRTFSRRFTASTNAGTFSGLPIDINILMTASLAPPWRGPLN